VQVIIKYLKQPGNYAAWRKASPAGKNKVIRILQEEMAERGMQSASRDPKAILAQIWYSPIFRPGMLNGCVSSSQVRKIVRNCIDANAFEQGTGQGLTPWDIEFIDRKREDGVVSGDESDLNGKT
jgi:hypothetical protein